jgi:hypothetical protein
MAHREGKRMQDGEVLISALKDLATINTDSR